MGRTSGEKTRILLILRWGSCMRLPPTLVMPSPHLRLYRLRQRAISRAHGTQRRAAPRSAAARGERRLGSSESGTADHPPEPGRTRGTRNAQTPSTAGRFSGSSWSSTMPSWQAQSLPGSTRAPPLESEDDSSGSVVRRLAAAGGTSTGSVARFGMREQAGTTRGSCSNRTGPRLEHCRPRGLRGVFMVGGIGDGGCAHAGIWRG